MRTGAGHAAWVGDGGNADKGMKGVGGSFMEYTTLQRISVYSNEEANS